MKYSTQDIITPANFITLAGLLLTLVGCFWLNSGLGLGLVLFGRMLDLVDGPVARATQTTKFSVFFDPTADKIALAGIIAAIIYYDMAPLPIVLYIAAQNLVVAILSIMAQRRQAAVGALIPGKLSIFFQTIAVLLFISARVLQNNWSGEAAVLAYTSFALSVPLSLFAIKAYADLLKRRENTETV